MKHKTGTIVAAVVVAFAVVIGGWALFLNGDDDSDKKPIAVKPTTTSTASAESEADKKVEAELKKNGLVIPKGAVDPTSGKDYCDSVKLLAIYARQGYGLDPEMKTVDGKKFDNRLKTIAAAYEKLAKQAKANPKAAAASEHWLELAKVTNSAEEKLRASGLQVQSQNMIVEFSKLAEAGRTHLPSATSTLKAACGLSPSVLGV